MRLFDTLPSSWPGASAGLAFNAPKLARQAVPRGRKTIVNPLRAATARQKIFPDGHVFFVYKKFFIHVTSYNSLKLKNN